MEGLNEGSGPAPPAKAPSAPRKNHAESIVDSAVVLLSRQLRGMCEASLAALTALFEDLKVPNTAGYSIFVVNLRLRKRSGSQEVTMDCSEPVDVCLQPDLEDVKTAMGSCIASLVGNSRNFPRPEQVIGPAFGGHNHSMVRSLMTTLRHKKMNESSVQLTDAVVRSTRTHKRSGGRVLRKFAAAGAISRVGRAAERSGDRARDEGHRRADRHGRQHARQPGCSTLCATTWRP